MAQEPESDDSPATPREIHYFVDEAGDPTLFDGKGRILVENAGCSRYFILGKLAVADVAGLDTRLSALRFQLLADPYFKKVPSMQAEAKKTSLAFHAKDDLPEVWREVFKLLLAEKLSFYGVVKDKRELVSYVQQQNLRDEEYHFRPNELYDSLISLLFSKLHGLANEVHICFAKRGKKDRTKALEAAIQKADQLFETAFGFPSFEASHVVSGTPATHSGLQAVDYFLWALQRFYEKREDRFLELIAAQTLEVHDLDFVENGRRGVVYHREKPLHLAGRIKKSGI